MSFNIKPSSREHKMERKPPEKVNMVALWPYKYKTHRTYKPSYAQTLLPTLHHSQGRTCTRLMLNASSNYRNQSRCRILMLLKGWLHS